MLFFNKVKFVDNVIFCKLSLIEVFCFILFNKLYSKFILGFLLKNNSIYLFINNLFLHFIIFFVKNSSSLLITSLLDISAVDYLNNLKYRFELSYSLWSHFFGFRIFLKFFCNLFSPILSINCFFSSASWLEREIWDLFGIKFLLNIDLRRILTDYGFHGHPFRKDFPLIGYVELRYDDLYQAIVLEPVELSQKFRFFTFENPWISWKIL